MTKIIVLFNLHPDADKHVYEDWARTTDLPVARKLPSIDKFEVFRTTGLLDGGEAPYQYIEVLEVNDLEQLGVDASSDAMQKVAAEFASFAANPQFILTESL
ncbi:MAG: REDY-like protein HapK [Alteromonadaceae bacterium]|nr:REDY-like protein HapK [Alteromonadaceae bacterium]